MEAIAEVQESSDSEVSSSTSPTKWVVSAPEYATRAILPTTPKVTPRRSKLPSSKAVRIVSRLGRVRHVNERVSSKCVTFIRQFLELMMKFAIDNKGFLQHTNGLRETASNLLHKGRQTRLRKAKQRITGNINSQGVTPSTAITVATGSLLVDFGVVPDVQQSWTYQRFHRRLAKKTKMDPSRPILCSYHNTAARNKSTKICTGGFANFKELADHRQACHGMHLSPLRVSGRVAKKCNKTMIVGQPCQAFYATGTALRDHKYRVIHQEDFTLITAYCFHCEVLFDSKATFLRHMVMGPCPPAL